MEISIIDLLKATEEKNRAVEMALNHAVLILSDFTKLTPCGRAIMTQTLMELIAEEPTRQENALYSPKPLNSNTIRQQQ